MYAIPIAEIDYIGYNAKDAAQKSEKKIYSRWLRIRLRRLLSHLHSLSHNIE